MHLPKAYDPSQYEADIYYLWEKNDIFKPAEQGTEATFSIVAPPPNANANLHIGYGLTMAIEDTIVRYHRLKGDRTIFVPGADHAGFETWVVYEKRLANEGKSRFDYSREELYQQVWDFVQMNKKNFEAQIRALGASVDWSRFTFTLDEKVVETAYETFKKMWDDELIYRGERVVNFCTFHGTSFSDIEVVHEEEDTKLWYIAYPLASGEGEVVIATSRPETKLGQSALMVNPKDNRYKHLIGQKVNQPLVPDKPIAIVADDYVDMKFGTGVVTVTPGHDPNDFEVARRKNLPAIELITKEGVMGQNVPEQFRGLTIIEARQAVEKELEAKGFLRKVEPYRHSVGKCYKCGTVIEPLLSEQWFVSMKPLAKKAIKALEDDKIRFFPGSKKNQLIRYLTEARDWNISRQIAWGIPIPAFCNKDDPRDWIFDKRVDRKSIKIGDQTYVRDPDVFDTWFSSGQWPYLTLNYPDGRDYKDFYPLSVMETGNDILYQWVARMIMFGLYITDEVPFKDVYVHGYIRAQDGTKMSKSLGNTVDVMEVIASHGSDALRMGLLAGRAPAVARPYDPRRIEEARNFCNKIWNIARFIEDKVDVSQSSRAEASASSAADHWILSRLAKATAEISASLENYRLAEGYELLYHFIWHDLADWYIETSKVAANQPLLALVLELTLKLAHPFAPFVTETIWQTLAWEEDSILAGQGWPQLPAFDAGLAGSFQDVLEIITEVRTVTVAVGAQKPNLYHRSSPVLAGNSELIKKLGRVGDIVSTEQGRGMRLPKAGYDLWLDMDTLAVRSYLDKLIDQKAGRQAAIEQLEGRLSNPSYSQKAPKEIIDQTRQQLSEQKELLDKLSTEIEAFSNLAENSKS